MVDNALPVSPSSAPRPPPGPAGARLSVRIRRVRPAVTLICPAGEVDLATAGVFARTVLDTVGASPGHRIVLEFDALTFLGACGLGTVVRAEREAARRRGRLVLVAGPDAPVASCLRFLHPGAETIVHRSLAAALASDREP